MHSRSDKSGPTSPIPSPSPSALLAPSPSKSPLSRPPVLRRPTDDGFTERFQYLVASSGLLEKTQILSLVSAQEDDDSPPITTSPEPSPPEDKLQQMIVRPLQQHWDVVAASAVVIVSVLYVLGLSMLLVPSAAVAGGAALLLPSKSDTTPQGITDGRRDSTVAAATTAEEEKPSLSEDSTTRIFNTLNALLVESRSLDQAIGSAMALLAPKPDDIENAHGLRIALHRLFSDMTDSLAATTSTLIPMADRSELTVLGDMYDIPVLGNRRRRASSSSSEESTTAPVPHRHRSLSTSAAVTSDDPGTSASVAADPSDRFTPLPVRHLRHKRSTSRNIDPSPTASPLRPYSQHYSQLHSRDTSAEGSRGHDDESGGSTEGPDQLGSRPGPAGRAALLSYTPKRASPLTHGTLDRGDAQSGPAPAPSAYPGTRTTSPTSFHMRPSQSPFRRSLQDIPYIHSTPSSSAEQAAELAKARASSNMSSAKRRSLQTPYNLDLQREQALVEASAGLTRATSLTYGRSAHSDALAALEGKRPAEPIKGLRPLTMTASLSTPGRRLSSAAEGRPHISPPRQPIHQQQPRQQEVAESRSRNRNSIILDSGSAAMAHSDAVSSRRSSTTLEAASSPDSAAGTSKRSSLLTDQGPAGKRVQALMEQSSLGLGHSPRAASLGVPAFQRVPSVSPLTLGGLKASSHGVHLKRRRVACCLLGLRFSEPRTPSSSYWDAVCSEMEKLAAAMALGRESLDTAREEVEREVAATRALAESARRYSMPASSVHSVSPERAGPRSERTSLDGPVDFAPRSDPMLSSVDELQRTLARVWAKCDELRSRGVALEPEVVAQIWADVRADVGGMLRSVERGREAVRPPSEAGGTDPTDSEIMPISASSDMEPGFLRAWADADAEESAQREAEEIERLVAGEDHDQHEAHDEFLPPPGIDEVFEAAIPPAPPRARSGLSREERIKAAKEARNAAMDRLTANSTPEVRGQVMQELEGVFGVIRQRKGYSREPAPEAPSTPAKAQPVARTEPQPQTESSLGLQQLVSERVSERAQVPASYQSPTSQVQPLAFQPPSQTPSLNSHSPTSSQSHASSFQLPSLAEFPRPPTQQRHLSTSPAPFYQQQERTLSQVELYAAESAALAQEVASRASTPGSTPASARVATPNSIGGARLVASPSRSPTVVSQPYGLPRIGSPTFRVTSPVSPAPGSPIVSSRVVSPTPSAGGRERVASPPPTAWSRGSVRSPTRGLASPPPSSPRATSPLGIPQASPRASSPLAFPHNSSTTSLHGVHGEPSSPSYFYSRSLSPNGPYTPTRSPSFSLQPNASSPNVSISPNASPLLTRAHSLSRASSLSRVSPGARKQRGMSLQPIVATVPMATSPEARRRSLQTLYEGSNASSDFVPIQLRAPEEVADDEIGVAI